MTRPHKTLLPGAQFQVIIRLQLVRRLVYEWQDRNAYPCGEKNPAQELIAVIRGTAAAARAVGLAGFTSVCLRVCERVAPLIEGNNIPLRVRVLLQDWSAHSEIYLRRPYRAEFSEAVVAQLNDWQIGRAHV